MENEYKRPFVVRFINRHKPALKYVVHEVLPVTEGLIILGICLIAVMLTVGEMQPPGHGVDLSSHSSSTILSLCDRYDGHAPGTTYATRAGHDLEGMQ